MISITNGCRVHSRIPGNCRVDELARRGTTIKLSDEFSNLGISMSTCKLIIDNVIVDSIKDRWADSDTGRTARKIWQKLDEVAHNVSIEGRSVWLPVSLGGIALWVRMRGAFVLNTLLTMQI